MGSTAEPRRAKSQATIKAWGASGQGDRFGSRSKKRELVPKHCEICGYVFKVTRHRIKPGSEGGKYVPGNVIGLCPNHHAEADAGAIGRVILFEIVQMRLKRQNGG